MTPARELGAWCAAVLGLALLLAVAHPASWSKPAGALALAAGAAVGGALASRGAGRRLVGVALVLVGLLAATRVALVGAPLVALGVVAVVRAGRWPALGRRYAAADRARPVMDDPWAALDRGVDPTADPGEQP